VVYGFMFWFPTMLKRQSGFSDARVGVVGMIPYLAAFISMQINGWHSDKRGERRWHSAVPMFVAALGLLGLLGQPRSIAITVALFSLTCMAHAYLPTFWAMPTEILDPSTAAAAVGLINALGSAAGFAAPYAIGYLHTETGTYSYGLAMMMVAALGGGLLILRAPKKAPLSPA
jgi:MFS transporter, ACS family, tartrate transporter